MKQFFGPMVKMFVLKVILTMPIFVLVDFILALMRNMADYHYLGFPLKYLGSGGMGPSGPISAVYNYPNLVLDVLIWFLVTCLIITLISFIWRKAKSPSATATA